MKNNNSITFSGNEESDNFINEIEQEYSIENKLSIHGKELSNNDNQVIYFICEFYKSTDLNSFPKNIMLGIELENNLKPYIRILTDFTNPTYNDNRNIFYVLTDQHHYIYNRSNKKDAKDIIKVILDNFPDFLTSLKENLQIDAFVYFGEYELNRIYSINDFLKNKTFVNFFRVLDYNTKNKEEKYVIITQLYFLVFNPLYEDKSLGKLIMYHKLLNIRCIMIKEFTIDKNKSKIGTVIKIETNSEVNVLDYIVINKKAQCNIDLEEDINDNTKNNIHNIENTSNINTIKSLSNQSVGGNFKEYTVMKNLIEKRIKQFKDKNYQFIINDYKLLINHRSDVNKLAAKYSSLSEYDRLISYCEKLYTFFSDKQDEKTLKRLKYFSNNIIFFCSEVMGLKDAKQQDYSEYVKKMKIYLNLSSEN